MSRLATTVVGRAASVWLATDGRAGAIVVKVYVDPGSPAAFERLVSHVRAVPGHDVVRSLPHQGVLWFTARQGARPDADQVRAEAERHGLRVLRVEVKERRPEERHRGCPGHEPAAHPGWDLARARTILLGFLTGEGAVR